MSAGKPQIEIDADLYGDLQKIVAQSARFDSVGELVHFVLRELLSPGDETTDEKAAEVLRERLKALGYLDE